VSRHNSIGIAAAAEQTGLSIHTLRVWERRYGFPLPARTTNGERLYPADQVHKLTLLRSLSERGHRPGQIARRSLIELEQLMVDRSGVPIQAPTRVDIDAYLNCLTQASVGELRRRLRAALVRRGLARFVIDKLTPLSQQIAAWRQADRINFAQERLFADEVERLLREAITPLEETLPLKIMLATLPAERDSLALLMIEAMLRLEGAACLPVGVETPPEQLARLAVQSDVDVVVLSFGAGAADPNGRRRLADLRQALPGRAALWVAGPGARRVAARALYGVRVFDTLEQIVVAFRRHAPA
jgi:MerR family transcriptional regulator, light-induced transcriptional regulator